MFIAVKDLLVYNWYTRDNPTNYRLCVDSPPPPPSQSCPVHSPGHENNFRIPGHNKRSYCTTPCSRRQSIHPHTGFTISQEKRERLVTATVSEWVNDAIVCALTFTSLSKFGSVDIIVKFALTLYYVNPCDPYINIARRPPSNEHRVSASSCTLISINQHWICVVYRHHIKYHSYW